jgi:hypothetical protein
MTMANPCLPRLIPDKINLRVDQGRAVKHINIKNKVLEAVAPVGTSLEDPMRFLLAAIENTSAELAELYRKCGRCRVVRWMATR